MAGLLDNPLQLLDEETIRPQVIMARLEVLELSALPRVFLTEVRRAAKGLMERGQADELTDLVDLYGDLLDQPQTMLLDARQRKVRIHLALALTHLDALGSLYSATHNEVIRGAYLAVSEALKEAATLESSLPWTSPLRRKIAKASSTRPHQPQKLRKRIRLACQTHERLFAHWTPRFDGISN